MNIRNFFLWCVYFLWPNSFLHIAHLTASQEDIITKSAYDVLLRQWRYSRHSCNCFITTQSAGAKLKKIVGGMQNPNMPTNRLRTSPLCRQIGLSCILSAMQRLRALLAFVKCAKRLNIGGGVGHARDPYCYVPNRSNYSWIQTYNLCQKSWNTLIISADHLVASPSPSENNVVTYSIDRYRNSSYACRHFSDK